MQRERERESYNLEDGSSLVCNFSINSVLAFDENLVYREHRVDVLKVGRKYVKLKNLNDTS